MSDGIQCGYQGCRRPVVSMLETMDAAGNVIRKDFSCSVHHLDVYELFYAPAVKPLPMRLTNAPGLTPCGN